MPPPDPAPDPSYSSREGGLAAGDLSAFNEVGDVFFFFFLGYFFSAARSEKKKKKNSCRI